MANFYKNAFYDPTTTSVVSVYSCPADSRAIIQNIQVTNESGTKIHKTSVTDNSGPTICNVAKGPIILEESDILKMECNTTTGVSAIVSVLEMNRSDENG